MLLGPKANGPQPTNPRYRILRGVKPYAGRILWPETISEDRITGRIKGVTALRTYKTSELEEIWDYHF